MQYFRETRRAIGSSAAITCCLAAVTLACSDGEVNLGEGLITQPIAKASRCSESASISGDIHVASQSELDALTGCEEIDGGLSIEPFAGADLSPLGSLRRIGGELVLGAQALTSPEDPDEQQAASERYQALLENGWLDTLGGLASLTSVGAMAVYGGVEVEDLTELTSLRSIELGLTLFGVHELRDLHGLDRVTLPGIQISDCEALESLDGLHLAPASNYVMLEVVPALKNIDPLSSVESLSGGLTLTETGIEALPDLSGLMFGGDIDIGANLLLTDASGLSGLIYASRFKVGANPLLRALPDLSQLLSVDMLRVTYNDSLEAVTLNFPALSPATDQIDVREIQFSTDLIEIRHNAGLRHVTSPASFTAVQYFSVEQNPSLTDLDLGTLERADFLTIADNAALRDVVAPSLATVDQLQVTNNPVLDPSAFDSVLTFSRDMSGNAAPSTP
jgi:hypothetical protein